MGLRDRLRRLRQRAEESGVLIRQRDGSTKVFPVMKIHEELFLTQMDLLEEKARKSDVLAAVRNATPESRQEFSQRFGSIAFSEDIICGSEGWVSTYTLTEDGTVEKVRHEGDSEEATRIREGAKASPEGTA